ncbi:hypothetical protein FOL47_000701, partial [Perkinsus chesapeaki]
MSEKPGSGGGGPKKQWGVSPAVSLSKPGAKDVAATEVMNEVLVAEAPQASEEERQLHKTVFSLMSELVSEWGREYAFSSGLEEKGCHCELMAIGSARLGLQDPSSDIDCVVVAGHLISRDAFFKLFPVKLSERNDITNLNPVPQAAVPVIKMKCMDVDVDVLFCGLAHPMDGPLDPSDDTILCDMDEKSARSINGVRVSDAIKASVPNFDNFLGALRLIRGWARRRGVYSNALGYLGGVSWAILVARICQLFPHMCSSQLVVRFFRVYSRWNWDPSEGAVVLKHSEQRSGAGYQHHRVWCPPPKRTGGEQAFLPAVSPMAVITPAYPSMNSTFGVTGTTMTTLKMELERGAQIISAKGVDLSRRKNWESLIDPFHFFDYQKGGYKQFLQIEVVGASALSHKSAEGLVNSKIKPLLMKKMPEVAAEDNSKVPYRAWTGAIPLEDPTKEYPYCSALFVGLSIPTGIDLRPAVREFMERLGAELAAQMPEYKAGGMFDVRVRHVTLASLPDAVKGDSVKRKVELLPDDDNVNKKAKLTNCAFHPNAPSSYSICSRDDHRCVVKWKQQASLAFDSCTNSDWGTYCKVWLDVPVYFGIIKKADGSLCFDSVDDDCEGDAYLCDVKTTEPPTETTEAPNETTDAPTETTDAPTETSDAPTETTDAPTETSDAPTETTDAPTETTDAPTETTDAPTET